MARYEHLSREELVRLLEARDRRDATRFGLVWEANEVERDRALNRDFVALDLAPELCVGPGPWANLVIEGDNFYLYQLPVPRLTSADSAFRPIVERAARLVCTTPEFDDLAREVFGPRADSATVGATEFTDRAQLRAELDGLVAHLYGLTEDQFAHILSTFPLVPDPVKVAAHNAFRNIAKGLAR
jgi:hypothetical protein